MRRGLLFLSVGAALVVLTACSGGGSGGGGSGNPNTNSSGGGGSSGGSSAKPFEVELTFAPIVSGFNIGNQSDFGDFVSLNITATSGGNLTWVLVPIAKFSNGSYEFTGLNDQSNYTFAIKGILSDGREREVAIVFSWDENEVDHKGGGIRSGLNTDGDRQADSVDTDDDNDGVLDLMDTGMVGSRECRLYEDCDNDGIGDGGDQCRVGETGWESNTSTDHDGDGCRDASEDADDDNDGILDLVDIGRVGGRVCRLSKDCDGDEEMDSEDVDRDGDGLIEIATAEELNAVRYALNSSGRQLSADGAFDTSGCGDGSTITSCSGYELVANISLAAYRDNDGGKGWQPLGHDTNNGIFGCQGNAFNGTFEGNGFAISNLNINRSNQACVGLFGHIASGSEIVNLSLFYVGGLVGAGDGARIASSSVVTGEVSGEDRVGGLVGHGDGVRIASCSVVVGEVSGRTNIGGLIGHGEKTEIISSSVVAGNVSGGSQVGGLVGYGQGAQIVSSLVIVDEVRGENKFIGGLVGWGFRGIILFSSVVVGEVRGQINIGGLVGYGNNIRIVSSSIVADEVSGSGDTVGGLVGSGASGEIFSSSVVAGEVNGSSNIGGLVGWGASAEIVSSSVVAGQVSGTGNYVGGLVGVGSAGQIIFYSYVVTGKGSGTSMLVGFGSGSDTHSYWDRNTSGVAGGSLGDPKTTVELRTPTNYTKIYEAWDDGVDIDNMDSDDDAETGVDNITIYCDEDASGDIEEGEDRDDNRIWDFGTSNQYPAIRCTPIAPTEWRSWWFLNGTGEPELNQTRLDALLSP